MSQDELMVVKMLGCTQDEAVQYLKESNGDILLAVCNHSVAREVSGSKYIPEPPTINDGLTPEVREKLQEARKMGDMFSASFRNDLRGVQEKTSDVVVPLVPAPLEQQLDSQAQIDVGEY
jgi:hypothetical protein